MFFTFDQWLIGKFEKAVSAFAMLTGKDNYFLAKFFLCMAAASQILIGVYFLGPIFTAVAAICAPMMLLMANRDEQEAQSRRISGLANPHKITYYYTRMLFSFLSIGMCFVITTTISSKTAVSLHQIHTLLSTVFFCLFYYLLSCDITPPAKSLFRKWAEHFQVKPVHVSVPVRSES